MAYKNLDRKQMCSTFKQMRQRCNNPNNSGFENYGGRGIRCLFTSVQDLIDEVGYRPDNTYTIDRIDNSGNYEHGNIRWAKRDQQVFNSRLRVDNKTGIAGVFKRKGVDIWCASHRNKHLYEGRSLEKAIQAKQNAMEKEHNL